MKRAACIKAMHLSKAAAASAAFGSHINRGGARFRTYRCTTCRFGSGQRAWHWTRDARARGVP